MVIRLDTVAPVSAIEVVLAAFRSNGWAALSTERVSGKGSPNPTRVDLGFARQRLPLMMYAWKLTGEGNGRTGGNFRIQTTRSHPGELLSEDGRLTLGFGISASGDVVSVFDGWTKRNSGSSSSVYVKQSLLAEAADGGLRTDGSPWDARAACRSSEIHLLLPWINRQANRRLAAVQALSYDIDGQTGTATADLWDSAPAAWLRAGDQMVLVDRTGTKFVDDSIWTVKDLSVNVTRPGRNPRRAVTFTLKRHGRAKTDGRMLEGLTRRPIT